VNGLLRLPAWLYGAAVALRNRHYDRDIHRQRCGCPVISVGNLTVGGTGKTPTVAWLAHRFLERGKRPAVVSRGYGGSAGRGPLLVSSGAGPLCSAQECGDEPFLLAGRLPGALVVVGADRLGAAARAVQEGADVVLLDDGFQHRRLERDLDIVLLDSRQPFGNGQLIPAGPLREPIQALTRADWVVATRCAKESPPAALQEVVRDLRADLPLLAARHRTVGLVDRSGSEATAPARVWGFCGIGRPESFRAQLEQQPVELAGFSARRDHHRFTESELADLRDSAAAQRATLVTTEKDRARIDPEIAERLLPGLLALRIELELHHPERLLEKLTQILP